MSDRIAVMHGGRVQQIGTPAEIYDRSANRFVAGFIGETNFLSVRIQASRVMCSGSPLVSCQVPDTRWHDGNATWAVRPERMQLASFDAHIYSSVDAERFLVFPGDGFQFGLQGA